jgi:DNA-binding SARP family transcriptional activator
VLGTERDLHEAAWTTAHQVLGEAAFAAAWDAGAALDLDGVFALAESAEVADPPAAPAAGAAPAVAPRSATPGDAGRPAPAPAAMPAALAAAPLPAAGAPPALAVHLLGPLTVARAGVPLAAGELPAGKATELLLYLVLHPEGRTKEQVGLALWPDASAGQLRGSFHVMLHHLRRALGGGDRDAARPWIAFADGRYRLERVLPPPGGAAGAEGAAALDCDVDALADAAERLRLAELRREAVDEAELERLAAALARRRGELGEGVAAGDWLLAHQDRVRALWGDAMQALARQHARAGRRAGGARVLEALVAAEPLREGAHRELMVLWAADGERARALGHYESLVELLRREVGAPPARDTQLVAESIRRG